MPVVDDYDPSEDDQDQGSAGGSSGGRLGASTGTVQAAPTKQDEPDFVPWSRFVSANQDVAQREAGKLATQVQTSVDKAQSGLNSATAGFNSQIESNYRHKGDETDRSGVATPKVDVQQAFGGAVSSNTNSARTVPIEAPPPAAPPQSEKPGSQKAPPATPWQSMIQAGPQAGPEIGEAAPQQQLSLTPTEQRLGVTDQVRDNGPTGPKDLEASLGADSWSSLLGDTMKAQGSAAALGSDAGVQGLIQANNVAPGSAFDAALVSGQGDKQFQQLAKQYGGDALQKDLVGAQKDSQAAWAQLKGDSAADKGRHEAELAERDAEWARKDALAKAEQKRIIDEANKPEGEKSTGPKKADSWDEIDDILFGEGDSFEKIRAEMHRAGLSFSPLDWAAWGLGESGVDSPMPSEEYVKAFGANGGENWQKAKVRWAYFQVMYEYGELAAKSILDQFYDNPEALSQYMAMKNPGFMARNMRMLLESAGYQKKRSFTQSAWDNLTGGNAGNASYKSGG